MDDSTEVKRGNDKAKGVRKAKFADMASKSGKRRSKSQLKNSAKSPVTSIRPGDEKKKEERIPVPKEILEKHTRVEDTKGRGIQTTFHKAVFRNKHKKFKYAAEQAARMGFLLPEDSGYLQPDEDEVTRQFKQDEIARAVDITSAKKQFDLDLPFGSYRSNFTRNGRHLLLGGKKGHVAALDWVTKKLMCELNVMEEVVDVRWLHIETMFAVAQKEWVYIYDNQGIELHCLKTLNRVLRMDFLPYHFLLATSSENGWLKWLDVSIGKLVAQYNTRLGRLGLMCQNPYNAVLCLGHSKGIVSMWSPTVKEPLAKMMCHPSPLLGLAVDRSGRNMATSGADSTIRIWDLRKLNGPLREYRTRYPTHQLAYSDQGLLGTASGNIVEVYKDPLSPDTKKSYINHKTVTPVTCMQFCPYEDVLGIGHGRGFSSLLIPGSGEPNFDSREANPFQAKSQRREAEVRALLDKIQPELISLDPTTVAKVHIPTLEQKFEEKKASMLYKTPDWQFSPKHRTGKRGGSVQASRAKKIEKEKHSRLNRTAKLPGRTISKTAATMSVLDRFRPKEKS